MTLEEFVLRYSDGCDDVYVRVNERELIAPICHTESEDDYEVDGQIVMSHHDCGRPSCWGCQIGRDRPLNDETLPGWKLLEGTERSRGFWFSRDEMVSAYSVWETCETEE